MKLLIIAPFFAPYSLVGANRMMSLSRFLVERGHEVTVWAHDRDTLARLSDADALCSDVPEGVRTLRFSVPPASAHKYLSPISYQKQVWASCKAARRQLGENGYDAVLMSCGPTYQQKAGLQYARQRNIPLVMDMRDLNVLAGRSRKRNRFLKTMQNLFWRRQQYGPEKRCMTYAEKIVVVVPGADSDVEAAYGIPKGKTAVIYNGYDEAILSDLPEEPEESAALRIGIFGKFMHYSPERGRMLLAALDFLWKSGTPVELYHVGPDCREAHDAIRELGLCPQIYHALGPKEYRTGMTLMQNADLYAMEHLDPNGLGTKVFDYFFFNKPIVCIAPKKCALARMVSSFENGFSCDSREEVVAALRTIVEEHRTVLDRRADLSVYSRRVQNERYETLLLELGKKS